MNSKNKGNTYERKIANKLSLKFKTLLNEEQGFRRNPDSGSYFGGSHVAKLQTHNLDYAVFGDIICPRNFNFTIECKHYKSPPTFNSIINQKVPTWDEWIGQAVQDSKSANKKPLLIIKYNKIPDLAFVADKIDHLPLILTYSNLHLYKLDDLLTLDPSFYFT